MRRSVADLEHAEQEYQLARRKFVNALRTWEKEEAKRDQVYKDKLRRSLAVLTTLGTEAVTNALDKAIAELEAVSILQVNQTMQSFLTCPSFAGHATLELTISSRAFAGP